MNNRPIARKSGLVVQEADNELLVYDLASNKAHCLNETAARVWRFCDGNRTPGQIADVLTAQFGTPVPEELVWMAIDEFATTDLLEEKLVKSSNKSRREVIKTLGLATMISLPVVASLVAPPNALSSSSCVCTSPSACNVQTSCPSTDNCNGIGLCTP